MADEKKIRSSADRDADAALEEILREVEASPRRTAKRRESDDLDFVQTGTPRSHAATPKTPVRGNPEPEQEDRMPEREKPRREQPAREDREQKAPVRRSAEQAPQRRRPEEQRANGQQNRVRRDVEQVDAPRRAPKQRPQNGGQQRAPQHRPEGQRPQRPQEPQRRSQPQREPVQQQRQRSAEQRVPQQRSNPQHRQHPVNDRPHQKRSAAAAKRRPNYFRIGLAIYIMLGLILTLWGMRRLHNFLKEYEDSRPEYTIDGYVSHLNSGFYSDMVRQKVDEIPVTDYETADTIASTLDIESLGGTGYTWVKKVDEYSDEKPVYYIRYNGASIATVALQRVSGTEKFDFPVWKTMEPESLIELSPEAKYTLDVTVPDGGSLLVNGLKVPMSSLTDTEYDLGLDDKAKNVVESPVGQHVKIDGLFVTPEVRAFDADGNSLSARAVPDASEKEQVYVFEAASKAEPNPVLVARIEELTKAYINYMINKDEATWANRQYLDNFVLNGSDAFTVLHGITADVAWNNPYTARVDKVLEVSNVKMYSDTICTADAHFELQLTKESDHGTVTNDYNGTLRWLMVKNGNAWYATHFDLLNGQDDAADDAADGETAGEAPAEE